MSSALYYTHCLKRFDVKKIQRLHKLISRVIGDPGKNCVIDE